MTFGSKHYVPVLKVKRAEKLALSLIAHSLMPYITPVLEIVPKKPGTTIQEHLSTTFRDLAVSVSGYSRCFLDTRELGDGDPGDPQVTFARALSEGIAFTPVTGITRRADVVAALSLQQSHGLAIRLTRNEFEEGRIVQGVDDFLSRHGLAPDQIDLIVDLGSVESLITVGVYTLTSQFLADIPHVPHWRTLTVSASAFPKSMGIVEGNSSLRVSRSDWLAWKNWLFRMRNQMQRLPTFSDCAIQHPEGIENFDFRFMRPSPTVRYTSGDDWLLIKGETRGGTLPSEQFPLLAGQLAYGHLRSAYAGSWHCEGCRQARESADGVGGRGSPEVWRRIGTIHHITSVVDDDLLSLPWP